MGFPKNHSDIFYEYLESGQQIEFVPAMYVYDEKVLNYNFNYGFNQNVLPSLPTREEQVEELIMKTRKELKYLGYPLKQTCFNPQTDSLQPVYGVNIHYAEYPQAALLKQLRTGLIQEQEEKLQPLLQGNTLHYCSKCSLPFLVDSISGDYVTRDPCLHHPGKLYTNYNCNTQSWTCCNASKDSLGCVTSNSHVWMGLDVGDNGPFFDFFETQKSDSILYSYILGLDCEMVLTPSGQELAKVSIVDFNGDCVYETFVKPKKQVIDHCTQFSGIREEDLIDAPSFEEVQSRVLNLIAAETILVGHGLASDLRVLKILHERVIDTAAIFPHYRGLPFKNSLKYLAQSILKVNIQTGEHDPLEDARTAILLVKHTLST